MNELLAVFRALADPTRLRIFNLLSRGPVCVCHFQQILGISQVLVSQHLASLRKTGIVESIQHAQWRVCRLKHPSDPSVQKLLRAVAEATGASERSGANGGSVARRAIRLLQSGGGAVESQAVVGCESKKKRDQQASLNEKYTNTSEERSASFVSTHMHAHPGQIFSLTC
jgi:ArsR family transcriptional regulator